MGRRRPLRPARPDRRRGVGLRRAHLLAVQVLRPAHGPRVRPRGAARRWRPYKVRPAADEPVGRRFEPGTCQHELLAGFVAAVDYVDSLGWDAITAHERALGQRFLDGLPARVTLHGLPTMEGRVPTFCFSVAGPHARSVAEHLAEREVAVWWGDYYALETMRRLGLARSTAPSARASSTTTPRRRSTGCWPASRSCAEAPPPRRAEVPRPRGDRRALERGHEVTLFNRGTTNPELFPGAGADRRRPRRWPRRAPRPRVGRRRRHVGLPPARRRRRAPACSRMRSATTSSSRASPSTRPSPPVVDEELAARGARRHRARRTSRTRLRRAQGALRARWSRRRSRAARPPSRAGADRRPARPDRPLHVLAAPGRARRRRARPRAGVAAGPVVDVRDLAAWIAVRRGRLRARSTRRGDDDGRGARRRERARPRPSRRVDGAAARRSQTAGSAPASTTRGARRPVFRPLDDTVAATLAEADDVDGVGLTPEREASCSRLALGQCRLTALVECARRMLEPTDDRVDREPLVDLARQAAHADRTDALRRRRRRHRGRTRSGSKLASSVGEPRPSRRAHESSSHRSAPRCRPSRALARCRAQRRPCAAATISPWSSTTTTETGPAASRRTLATWCESRRHEHVLASPRGDLRAHHALQRHPAAHRGDAARAVGLVLRHVRRRLALRAARGERHRALRRAHVLQGHGAPADRARHRDRDRRDRRRVQRLHRQGVHRLLREVRRRARATSRSTCSSTCSATRSSTPRRSSARRA